MWQGMINDLCDFYRVVRSATNSRRRKVLERSEVDRAAQSRKMIPALVLGPDSFCEELHVDVRIGLAVARTSQ
jgi:hypothetical protein